MAVLLRHVLALQDASVYELIHEMLSGRQRPDKVEPLQVVVDEHGLHIVRGHRRGLALCALQGIWRDRTVLAPCRLYKANDPEVAKQFANMDTVVDGLSIQLHGKCPEAWHRGKPLFRTAEEWCDSVADMPVHSLGVRPESQAAGFNKLDLQDSRRSEPFSANAQLSHRGTLTKDSRKVEFESICRWISIKTKGFFGRWPHKIKACLLLVAGWKMLFQRGPLCWEAPLLA